MFFTVEAKQLLLTLLINTVQFTFDHQQSKNDSVLVFVQFSLKFSINFDQRVSWLVIEVWSTQTVSTHRARSSDISLAISSLKSTMLG